MSSFALGQTLRLITQQTRPLARLPMGRNCVDRRIRFRQRAFLIQNKPFSSSNEISSDPSDVSSMSTSQLKELALKNSRQDNPSQAQAILEELELHDATTPDLSDIETSIIHSWSKQQNMSTSQLKESIKNEDAMRVLLGHLKEIYRAAESASQVVENMEYPSSHHYIAALKCWTNVCVAAHEANLQKSSLVRGIPQRTEYLALSMPKPTVEIYNLVIQAWAYSGEHLRGTMAEQVFTKVEDPNGETFQQIIRAWCWSQERRCAFTATGHFMRMMRLLELGRSDMEPSMDDYRILFEAWTRAQDKNAASKVQTVLEIIEKAYRNGWTENRPDESCYRDCLVTISRRVNAPEIGVLADATLSEMKERMMIPDTTCYGAALLAWKNVATARECEDREKAVKRALEIFQEMTEAYHRTTKITVRPTTEHYNHALEALTASKSPKAFTQAEKLLSALEDTLRDNNSENEVKLLPNGRPGNSNVGPDAECYKLVLRTLQNRKKFPQTFSEAMDILKRMKDRLEVIQQHSSQQSCTEVFSAFILVCATCRAKSEGPRKKVMATVLRTIEDMRLLGLQPDSSTYAALIEAVRHLMPQGKNRHRLLESIFRKACNEGHVDQTLLEHFKLAASTSLFTKLVVTQSRIVENMKVVPESWTRNVKGFQASVEGGRKVLPLSIEGNFTFTKAAAEYKMRNLRKQENKKMLQGGRTR